MDKERFALACEKIIGIERERICIGTLSEKTLHAVLKNYFEPDDTHHEIKIGSFFADISNDEGIIEIQTRAFNAMRKKLDAFLSLGMVTVVYPIASTKWLTWVSNETGETSNKRRSPKKGQPYEIFSELYKIKNLLTHENLRFCIVMLDIEEYRNLDGWSSDKKKGSSRHERIPTAINEEIYIKSSSDYKKLIPSGLPEEFTAKDFKKASKLSPHASITAMNVLNHVGVVERIGKKGNAFIYQIANK